MVLSPKAVKSVTARSDLPISLWISCVRPPTFPREDSRVVRVCVDMGNIEYSAVSQPFPVFFKKGAGLLSKDAAQITLVLPNSTKTEPAVFFK
jgi:hypothetical protein